MLLNTDLHNDALQQQQRRMSAQVQVLYLECNIQNLTPDPERTP
jgi:hypothetical protein